VEKLYVAKTIVQPKGVINVNITGVGYMNKATRNVVNSLTDPLKLIGPFQKFVEQESIAGLFLIIMAIIAMIWANSPFYPEYEAVWNTPIGVHMGDFHFVKPLIFWINDGLMTVFFFYIGLELKRELIVGDINTPRKALFPFIAALCRWRRTWPLPLVCSTCSAIACR